MPTAQTASAVSNKFSIFRAKKRGRFVSEIHASECPRSCTLDLSSFVTKESFWMKIQKFSFPANIFSRLVFQSVYADRVSIRQQISATHQHRRLTRRLEKTRHQYNLPSKREKIPNQYSVQTNCHPWNTLVNLSNLCNGSSRCFHFDSIVLFCWDEQDMHFSDVAPADEVWMFCFGNEPVRTAFNRAR
jgi:hypothetical protein